MRSSSSCRSTRLLVALAAGLAGCLQQKETAWTTSIQVSTSAEVPVSGYLSDWCVVDAGGYAACFSETSPEAVVRHGAGAVAVSVGCNFACAVRTDRSVGCWTLPGFDASFDHGEAVVPPGLGPVNSVHAGCSRTCAVLQGGSVACWGRTGPSPAGLGPVHGLAVDDDRACAVRDSDGTLACWGRDGVVAAPSPGEAVPVLTVSTGGNRFCGLRKDRTAWCDDPGPKGASVLVDLGRLIDVRSGWSPVCGLDEAGRVGCDGPIWGLRASAPGARFLATSSFGVCAVDADGTLHCWKHELY